MKKLLSLLSILGVLIALSACTTIAGGQKGETSTQVPAPTTTSTVITNTSVPETKTSTIAAASDKETATSKEDKASTITREQAISAALKAANLTRDNVYDLEAELDYERGAAVWEVDFETREFEYSYDIDAYTGIAKRVDKDRD